MRGRRASLVVATLLVAAGHFVACEGDAVTPPVADAGSSDAARAEDAAGDSPTSDSGIDPDPVPPRPPGVPDGWELSTAYRKQCGFYLPSRRDVFPEPIQWIPCSVDIAGRDGGVQGCRETKVTWPSKVLGNMNVTHGAIDSAGRVLLTQIRVATEGVYYVTGEADGPVRSATFEGRRPTCAAYPEWTSGSGTLLRVYRGGTFDTEAVLLDDGSPNHRALKVLPTEPSANFYVGASKLARFDGTVGVGPLASMSTALLPPWDARFGQERFVGFADDHLVFFNSQAGDTAILAYASDGKYAALVDDKVPSSVESAFGTDGKEAAWLHSEGCTSFASCSSIELRTAPFTLSTLGGRRVRSIASKSSTMASVVACGRVAIESNEGFRIVELASGRMWEIPRKGTGYSFVGEKALAMTCDEIFLTVNLPIPEEPIRFRGARIRLDSLGPGLPPD